MPTSDFTYLEDKVISIIIQHNVQHDEPGDVQQRRGHVDGAPAGQTQHHHRARQDRGGEGNWKLRRMVVVNNLKVSMKLFLKD